MSLEGKPGSGPQNRASTEAVASPPTRALPGPSRATLADRALRELNEAAVSLDAASTREQMFEVTLKRTASVLGAYAGGIMLRDAAGTTLELVASFGYTAPIPDAYRRISLDTDLPAVHAVRSASP
ncbi:MAG TPA: hypothetical protein VMF13_07735, partial [Luteitalea sp.]|nr:hypothetical protein [Luteitalea sp.]